MATRSFSSKHSLMTMIAQYAQGEVPALCKWDIEVRDHQFYKVEWVKTEDAFQKSPEPNLTFKELARRNRVLDFYFDQLIEKHPRFRMSITFDEHGVIQLNGESSIKGELLCNEEGSYDQAILYIQKQIPEILKQPKCDITIQNGGSGADAWRKKIHYTYYFCSKESYGNIPQEIIEQNFETLAILNVDLTPNRSFKLVKQSDGSISTIKFTTKITITNYNHPDELNKEEKKAKKGKGKVW